jgi:hypothetical protein
LCLLPGKRHGDGEGGDGGLNVAALTLAGGARAETVLEASHRWIGAD